jgi:hypothetical protein
MNLTEGFFTYINYLIHPFRSHEALSSSNLPEKDFITEDISLYESLGFSWLFVVLNAFFRLVIISFILLVFVNVMDPANDLMSHFYSGDRYTGFYFIIFSTLLDVVFFPLVTLFIIQFWDFVIRGYAYLLGDEGDVDLKTNQVLSVALSSNALLIVPFFGAMVQRIAQFVQMYAGLRVQFKFSPMATLCILFTPWLVMLGAFAIIMLFALLRLL